MEVVHLTVGMPFNKNINKLRSDSIKAGLKFLNLAKNKKRRSVGFYEKILLLKEFIDTNAISDNDLIIFTDGYDVRIINDWKVIVERFLSFDCDVIFNGEKIFWPSLEAIPLLGDFDRKNLKEMFYVEGGGNIYLNSGVYMGYKWAIQCLVDRCIKVSMQTGVTDDQALMQYAVFVEKEIRARLDVEDYLMATFVHSEGDFDFDGFRLRNAITGQFPAIVHANGGKNSLRGFDVVSRIRDDYNIISSIYLLEDMRSGFMSYKDGQLFFSQYYDSFCLIMRGREGYCVY